MTQANYITTAFISCFEENHDIMMEIRCRMQNLPNELINACIPHALTANARYLAHANRTVIDIFFTAEEYDAICAFAENPSPEKAEQTGALLSLLIAREARIEGNETEDLQVFLRGWFLTEDYACCVAIVAEPRLHPYFTDLLLQIRGFLQTDH